MKRLLISTAAMAALLSFQPALAQDVTWTEEEKKDRDQFPKFEEAVKDWIPQEGFFRLYRKEKEEKLLAAVPKDLLGKPFFLATSVAGGSERYAGWQWYDKLVRLERFNKKLLLVELNTRQRADKDKPVAEVVRRTYADRLLATLDIKGIGPKKELLIDLGSLLAQKFSTFFGSFFSLRTSLARFSGTKAFPNNVEVAIQMPLYGDGTFMTIHYSISGMPELKDYTSRLADDRLGYFLTAIRDYTKGDPQEARMVRYINRWKLEKADPDLPLSPPKEPIVFFVEKTVPIVYRQAVAQGILDWNRAFEKIGIVGAIVVRQQTDTQFADLDPEDVRYNFFRWITSESAFAMGPSRVDPRNGRILDADILFDDSMLRGYMRDYDILIREAPAKQLNPSMIRFLEQHPERHPLARFRTHEEDPRLGKVRAMVEEVLARKEIPTGTARKSLGDTAGSVSRAEHLASLTSGDRSGGFVCQMGEFLPHQLGMAQLALSGIGKDGASPSLTAEEFNDYMAQIVKETVMHEVGHTLGLRHNFKASSLLDLDAINSGKKPTVISGSVMDYHPVNLSPGEDGKPQGFFLTNAIGPYDMLAIEYGYKLCKEDAPELKAVARKVAEQGLAYATDEDMGSPDPLIAQWDLGDDPIKYANYRLALVKKLWKDLEKRTVKDDESYSRLRRALSITLWEIQQSSVLVSRLVGGLSFFRDHRGDPKARPPIAVIESERQRAALQWLKTNIFAEEALAVPPEVVDKLAASRWVHWGSRDGAIPLDYSILDRILQIQSWAIFYVTADDALARVWENEQRFLANGGKPDAGKGPLTLPELFDTLEKAIFTELDSPRGKSSRMAPAISSRRQNLQDAYVRRMIQIALGSGISPPVANKLAWSRLMALESRMQGTLSGVKLDPYTKAHLQVLQAQSKQARNPEHVHIASGGCALAPSSDPGPWWMAMLLLGVLGLRFRQ